MKQYWVRPIGRSMYPMLTGAEDLVLVQNVTVETVLKKGDVILYQRVNGANVLHRIVKVKENSYTLCGDHHTCWESGICRKQIRAIVLGFYRKGQYISCENRGYHCYVQLWCCSKRLRAMMLVLVQGWDKLIQIWRKNNE